MSALQIVPVDGSPAAVAALAGCNRQGPVQAKQADGPVRVQVSPVAARELQRVVESVGNDNGTVIVQEHDVVDVSALRAPTSLQHARPTS